LTRILLTGAGGQAGWELARSLLPLGEVVAPPRAEFDLLRPDDCAAHIARLRPDVVVNPAAYTAVDRAESEPELALRINGEAPAAMARAAAGVGALFIHYSTDYVFDGTKPSPYDEDDAPNPRSAYGRSKLAGEEGVRGSGADHLIFRTSWVYAARGHNFLRTVLRLAREREELRVVADQIGTPTWARLIADATAQALRESQRLRCGDRFESGLYHLTARGETSWHGFASRIVERARRMSPPVGARAVLPIATADYPLPALRPANSRLSCARFMARFGLELPDWERCLDLAMQELADS
jgi:dTDP-4-dehydrorhamnose reductase